MKYIIHTFICTLDKSHFSAASTYFRLWQFFPSMKVLCHNIKNKIFFYQHIRNSTRLKSENQRYHGLSGDIIPRNFHGTILNQKLSFFNEMRYLRHLAQYRWHILEKHGSMQTFITRSSWRQATVLTSSHARTTDQTTNNTDTFNNISLVIQPIRRKL